MELTEFIEKYRVSNFETYLKDEASIEYWQNLIIEFTKDFAPLKSNIQILLNPALKRPHETVFGISFGNFCHEQIELIEIKNKFNLSTPIAAEYNNEYTSVFEPFGFEIFNEMFERFDIDITAQEKEAVNFMYSVLFFNNNLIKVKQATFVKWLNKEYKTQINKIRITEFDSKANEDRYNVYLLLKEKYGV